MICLNVSQLCINMHFWANEGLHHALLSKCWLKVFSGHFVTIVDERGQEQKTWKCGVDGMSCVLWPVALYLVFVVLESECIAWRQLYEWYYMMLFDLNLLKLWNAVLTIINNIYYIIYKLYMQSFDFAQSFVRIHHQWHASSIIYYIYAVVWFFSIV